MPNNTCRAPRSVSRALAMQPLVHFAASVLYEEQFLSISRQLFQQPKESSRKPSTPPCSCFFFKKVRLMSRRMIASHLKPEKAKYANNDRKNLTNDTFNTVLCEFEQFVNARPIITFSSSHYDNEVLPPNHFLLRGAFASMPPKLSTPPSTTTSMGKLAQQLSNHVRKCLLE